MEKNIAQLSIIRGNLIDMNQTTPIEIAREWLDSIRRPSHKPQGQVYLHTWELELIRDRIIDDLLDKGFDPELDPLIYASMKRVSKL